MQAPGTGSKVVKTLQVDRVFTLCYNTKTMKNSEKLTKNRGFRATAVLLHKNNKKTVDSYLA